MTRFDIKSQGIKSFIYYGLLIGTPLALISNAVTTNTRTRKIIRTILPTLILTMILIVGPMKILFSTKVWRTQTILYQNRYSSSNTVEFQMQDIGAFGNNKRIVEVFYLTPLFMITKEVPNKIEKRVEWVKLDKDINEIGLKFQ